MVSKWSKYKIEDIITTSSGGTPSRSNKEFYNGTIPWVKTGELKNKFIFKTEEHITEKAIQNSSAKFFPANTVLLAMYGATIGNCSILGSEASTNQACCAFLPSENIDYEFLFYKLSYEKNKLIALGAGGAQPNISQKIIGKYEINIPNNILEQQKIAAILSSVDEAIDKTEAIIDRTETVKKGVMQKLLTKGIGHTEFKETPVGKIPAEWEVLSFNNVFDRVTTKNKIDNQNVLTISGEHGLVSQLDYFNKSVSAKNLTNYIYLEKGDFAYNKSYSQGYPLGAIKLLDKYDVGVVSTLYICFRLKDSHVNGFYKYYFDSGNWHRQVYSIAPEGGRSHGLLNVGVKDFFEVLIPVPTKNEQMKIYNQINSIDKKIKKDQNKLDKLKRLKQGLMQQILTGKIRVPVDDSEEVLP